MAKYQLVFAESAKKDLIKLAKLTRQRIAKKLLFYMGQKDPLTCSRSLVSSGIGSYRFRVGHYRIVFDISGNDLEVVNVKHRKDVYNPKS